jgi:uncharacterized protein
VPRSLAAFAGVLAILIPLAAGVIALAPRGRELIGSGYRWRLDSASQLPLAFAASIAVGYREEMFFRSYMLTRLGELGVPAVWAAAASSILFAMGHWYEGLFAVALAALLGAYFSVIFIRTRSLHVIALAHGLYNFTVLAVSLFGPSVLPAGGKSATF